MIDKQLSLQEVQNQLYALLCGAVDYLEEKHIRYFLCGGTLLGAIRHNGFIPWDDDIDIFVPREDYEALKELIKKGDYNHQYFYFNLPGDAGYGYPFIKMADRRISTFDEGKTEEFNMDLNIDVFPLDGMPENQLLHKWIFLKNRIHRGVLATKLVRTGLNRSKPEQIVAKSLYRLWGGIENVCTRIDQSNFKMNQKYKHSAFAGDGPWQENLKDYYRLEWIFPLKKHVFVDREFNVPNDCDAFLKNFYGDYMTPPPEGKRARHYFKAYWK